MKNQRNFSKTCFQSVSDKTFILLGQNTSSQIDLVFYWKSFGKISQNVRFYYQTADYIDVIDGCWWRLWLFWSSTSTIYHNSCTNIQKRLPNANHQHHNVTNITVRPWSSDFWAIWAIWTLFFDWPFDHKLSKMNSIRMNCIYVYIHFFECNLKRKINFGHI